jgi:hypothetical protein
LQLQFLTTVELAGEFMFCGQLSSWPRMQYFPALHGLHVTFPIPAVPFRHRQKATLGLCGGLTCVLAPGQPAMCPPPRQ